MHPALSTPLTDCIQQLVGPTLCLVPCCFQPPRRECETFPRRQSKGGCTTEGREREQRDISMQEVTGAPSPAGAAQRCWKLHTCPCRGWACCFQGRAQSLEGAATPFNSQHTKNMSQKQNHLRGQEATWFTFLTMTTHSNVRSKYLGKIEDNRLLVGLCLAGWAEQLAPLGSALESSRATWGSVRGCRSSSAASISAAAQPSSVHSSSA